MSSPAEQLAELTKKFDALSAQESTLRAQRSVLTEEKKQLQRQLHDLYVEQLPTWLTREVVDAACPTHSRSSCSDQNPCNDYEVRCQRCYLLKIVQDPYLLEEGWRITLNISQTT